MTDSMKLYNCDLHGHVSSQRPCEKCERMREIVGFFSESDFKDGFESYLRANHPSRLSTTEILSSFVSHANHLLRERGTVVYSCTATPDEERVWDIVYDPETDGRKALLICVEPIEKDSAEKIVESLTNIKSVEISTSNLLCLLEGLIDRAKKLKREAK